MWPLAAVRPSVFRFDPMGLEAHHGALDAVVMSAARTKAGEIMAAIENGAAALAEIGLDPEAMAQPLLKEGLRSWLYYAELWIASVKTVSFLEGGTRVEGRMPGTEVYKALQMPALFGAWCEHAAKLLVSIPEGNASAPSPSMTGAGAQTIAGDA